MFQMKHFRICHFGVTSLFGCEARRYRVSFSEVAFDVYSFRTTDVTQALARVEIEGAEVRTLMAKGCSLDLHPSRYPPGH